MRSRCGILLAYFAVFFAAFSLRMFFFCGFILGDDPQEFGLIQHLINHSAAYKDQLQVRFGLWIFNVALGKLFGDIEAVFFLPSWICSSLLAVFCMATLRSFKYSLSAAAGAGLITAFAPFEVLMGTLRANDLFLTFWLAAAFYLFVALGSRPILQGIGLAVTLWIGFYVKAWLVYVFPILGLYFLKNLIWGKRFASFAAFTISTLAVHGLTLCFWKYRSGSWFPLFDSMPGTFPVEPKDLEFLFMIYPRFILEGSEFGTTLFGFLPHLLLVCLVIKAVNLFVVPKEKRLWDRMDTWLFLSYVSFFLLVNFFPNHFKFDAYYSALRIFRYLSPVSFFMTFHAAKGVVDISRLIRRPIFLQALVPVIVAASFLPDVYEVHRPGLSHRALVSSLRNDIREQCPPYLVIDSWQWNFWLTLHLPDACPTTKVITVFRRASSDEYFTWLVEQQDRLPQGSMLFTGMISYVHFTCPECGFRLNSTTIPFSEHWKEEKRYWPIWFDRRHEPVRLWSWQKPESTPKDVVTGHDTNIPPVPQLSETELFERAMSHFDKGEHKEMRRILSTILERFPNPSKSYDIAYFRAVTYWRDQNFDKTIELFQKLLKEQPDSHWAYGAHYHIGLAYKRLRNKKEAIREFRVIVDNLPEEDPLYQLAADDLRKLEWSQPLEGLGRAFNEFVYRLQEPYIEWIRINDVINPRYPKPPSAGDP